MENQRPSHGWGGGGGGWGSIRNMSYASIPDQVKFIDTIKLYQEPLHALAASMEPAEHENKI